MIRPLPPLLAIPLLIMLQVTGCDDLAPDATTRIGAPAQLARLVGTKPGLQRAVSAAARGEVSSFAAQIPAGSEQDYGFSDRAELGSLMVGPSLYRMVSLGRDGRLSPLDEWRAVVMTGGRYRCLCTVARVGGSWRVVDLGAATLAGELEALDNGAQGGGQRAILRAHELRVDFLWRAAAQKPEQLIPMRSAQRTLGIGPGPLSWTELKPLLRRGLHVPR